MKYEITIESLPQKNYLAIKGYMSWRNIHTEEYDEWENKYGFPDKRLVEQLKIKSGSDIVYCVFAIRAKKMNNLTGYIQLWKRSDRGASG